jgi:hypothetical protein
MVFESRMSAGLALARHKGATAFQHGHQRENVVDILARDFGDVAAAARLQINQAFRSQYLERLAQRRTRNAVLLGQFLLVDPVAGRVRFGSYSWCGVSQCNADLLL